MSEDREDVDETTALLTVRRVATITGLATRTVWRYRDAGFLPPAVRIGSAVRWRRNDIEEWIKEGCPPVRHVGAKGGAR